MKAIYKSCHSILDEILRVVAVNEKATVRSRPVGDADVVHAGNVDQKAASSISASPIWLPQG